MIPPAARTRPSASNDSVRSAAPTAVEAALVHVPVAGWYSSALVIPYSVLCGQPPTISTFPDGRTIALLDWRVWRMLPVTVNTPVAGSHTSALSVAKRVAESWPPATKTRPSASSVPVAAWRATLSDPVGVHVSAPGS